MPIKCECTGCGATLRVPDEMLGRKVRCPKCQMTFTAAEPESAPPPPREEYRDEPPPREEYRDDPPPPPPAPSRSSRDYDDEPESRPSRARSSNYDDEDSGRRDRRDDDYDDRPSRRRDDYDDDRPSRRRDDDYADRRSRRRDDDDDYPRRPLRRGGGGAKPSPVQTAGIMMLIGGIMGCLYFVLLALTCYGLAWPGTYFSIVMGIMAIIRGSQLMGDNAYQAGPSHGIAIMMIINIINCDVVTMTLGIVALVMLNNEESKRYFGE